jgi:hypothetical protein
MAFAGAHQEQAVLLLNLGALLVQEHRCAAAEQVYQEMHLHIQKNVFA